MKKISIIFAALFVWALCENRALAQTAMESDCYIVIAGQSAYGGGWYGCSLDLVQNDSTVGSFTFSLGSYHTDTVRISRANGAVSLVWNNGNYAYQASFTLSDSVGNTLYSCDDCSALPEGVFAVVDPCPTCPGVVVESHKAGPGSLVFSWRELGTATQWFYSISTTPTPGAWVATTDTVVTLTGLDANTVYYFFVYSYCGPGDTSLPTCTTARTDCSTAELPIDEGFENYDRDTQLPYCWMHWETIYYWTSVYPSIDPWYTGHTGTNSLYFAPNQGTQSLIGPKMPVAANQVEMLMWVNGEATVQVGYVTTNDTANAVFHHVGTVGGTTSYQQFHVSFDTVTATDSIWVAFRSPQIVEYSVVRIDDLVIRQINSCPSTSTPVVAGTGDSSVTLGWSCPSGTGWQVAYGPQGFDPDSATTIATTNTTSATITGLDNNIVYDFYVRSVCGTQFGYWSNAATAMPNVYAVAAGNDTVASCNRTVVDDGGLFDNATLGLEQTVVLMPAGTGRTVRIQGDAHLYSGYAYYYPNIMRVFAGTDTNGRLLASINSTDVDGIDITSEVGAMTLWLSYTDNESYAPEGFRFHVSCEDLPDCTTPYGLTVDNVTGHSATIGWSFDTTLGQASGFNVAVFDADSDVVVANRYVDGSDRSVVITDLTGRTHYRVELALDCSGVDTLFTTFATGCDVGGEVQVGTGNETSSYLPAGLSFSSTVSQQLYLGTELQGDSAIMGFRVYLEGDMEPALRQWEVYLDTTSATALTSTGDYRAPTAAQRYFAGSVSVASGWVEVVFNRPFVLPAGMNMLLTVGDVTGSSSGGYNTFRITPGTTGLSLYGFDYYGLIDATSPYALSSLYDSYRDVVQGRNTIVFLTPCFPTSCLPPTVVWSETTSQTASLRWNPGNDESLWEVWYRQANDTAWTVADSWVSDTSYTISGLVPATDYVIRVLSQCGDVPAPRDVEVTTQCGAMPVPFAEDFELFTAEQYDAAMQRCWLRHSDYPYEGYYYPCLETYYGGYMSSNSLKFTGFNSTVVLPEMAVGTDSLNVAFYATTMFEYYGDATLEVGVCTDPADETTYRRVATCFVAMGTESWHYVEADLDADTGTSGRIYIRNISEAEVYVDNLLVSRLPDCRRVSGIEVDVSVPGEALVTFTDHRMYNNYILYYNTVDNIATADSVVTTNDTVLLSGLPDFTLYYIWIRSICSDSNASAPTPATMFRTGCSVVEVTENNHYLEEFESGMLDCITQEGTEELEWENNVSNYNASAISGGHMAWINSYSTTAEAMLILPEMRFSTLTEDAELSFYRFQYQNPHPTIYDPAEPAGQLSVFYRTAPDSGWTLIAAVDSTVNRWQKFLFTLPVSAGATWYQVGIKGQPMGNYVGGIYIDNVAVKPHSSCMKPANVSVDNITDRTATVRWMGDSPSYRVEYRAANTLTWLSRTVTGADSVVLTPLEMTTRYQVRIIGLCSDGTESETSDVATFTTLICENHVVNNNWTDGTTPGSTKMAPLPAQYFCSYAEILVDSAVLAGMVEVTSIDFYVNYKGDAPTLGPCQIYMGHSNLDSLTSFQYDSSFEMVYNSTITIADTGANRVLLSSPFVWNGHDNVIVGFQCYSSNYSNYYYNYDSVTFATHRASAAKLFYGNTGAVWNSFTPDNANMISDANKGSSNMVPDLTLLGCLPVCHEPVVHYLTSTATSITVNWYNENAVVQVQIKPADAEEWSDVVFVNELNSNIHSHTFYGLDNNTTYDIRLRRDCTTNGIDNSEWVDTTATTVLTCDVPSDLTATDISAHSATLDWTDGPSVGNKWELLVWNSNGSFRYDVNTHPVTIDELTPGMNYHAKVRAYCGPANEIVGEWSTPISFENECYPVTDLHVAINGSDIELNWSAHPRHQQWLAIFGYEGFSLNEIIGYQIVDTNYAIFADLGRNTHENGDRQFGFRVMPICGEDWSGTLTDEATAMIVSIDEVENSVTRITMYPNPATEHVTLDIRNFDGQAEISVFGIDGRQVRHFKTTNNLNSLDVSSLTSGAYFVRVQTAEWTSVCKLIVQ